MILTYLYHNYSILEWLKLNSMPWDENIKCIKIDTSDNWNSSTEPNTIYLNEKPLNPYGFMGCYRHMEIKDLQFIEHKILDQIGNDTEITLATDIKSYESRITRDFFIEFAMRHKKQLNLICIGEWESEENTYRGLLRLIKQAYKFKSICFINRYGFIDLSDKAKDIASQFYDFEELIFDDLQSIISKASSLEKCTDKHSLYLYNHDTCNYELIHLTADEVINSDKELFSPNEFIAANDGKKVCNQLRKMRKDFASKYTKKYSEDKCTYKGPCRGTCSHCDRKAISLWKKYRPNTKKSNEILKHTAQIQGIERLRIDTDGTGVRTLVVMNECHLNCKYCINKTQINKFPFHHRTNANQLYNLIKTDSIYFEMSGGGVTFGGGEPLIYAEFIREFHLNYPKIRINIQTSLNEWFYLVELLLDVIDVWYIDIKDMNPEIYMRYTGMGNDNVIKNLEIIKNNVPPEKVIIKVPYIPGYNTEKDVESSLKVLSKMGFENFYQFEYITDSI